MENTAHANRQQKLNVINYTQWRKLKISQRFS